MAPKSQEYLNIRWPPHTVMPRLALEFLAELAVRTLTAHKLPEKKHLSAEHNITATSEINQNYHSHTEQFLLIRY